MVAVTYDLYEGDRDDEYYDNNGNGFHRSRLLFSYPHRPPKVKAFRG